MLGSRTRGFTLAGIVVAVGIIGLLLAMLLPAVGRVREPANRLKRADNLRGIGVAMQIHSVNQTGTGFPPTIYDPSKKQLQLDNAGYLVPNTFGKSGYVGENNVPTSLFLLFRNQNMSPLMFLCPSAATGDVNGDGHADILAANTAGTVSVLLGNGDGTFAAPVNYAAGNSPQDVKAVDMNHGGKLDLVVASAVSAGSVSVLTGNGDGTFQAYRSYSAFSAPYRMEVRDLNGDGNPDVVVANSYTSSCVTVLLGNPDGTLRPYHSYDTGSQPRELDAVDVDGDGRPDLVTPNGTSSRRTTRSPLATAGCTRSSSRSPRPGH